MNDSETQLRHQIILAAFQLPSVATMVSRTSSITNAFVSSVIPVTEPTVDEVEEALSILRMEPTDVRCAYCGDKASEWDHLRPLVNKKRPTGFITEIANLVPSCGKCNQSKGNKDWRIWIRNTKAKHSPTKRSVSNLEDRIRRLETYENWKTPTQIDFEQLLGPDEWSGYWALWDALITEMKKCQEAAELLRDKILQAIRRT